MSEAMPKHQHRTANRMAAHSTLNTIQPRLLYSRREVSSLINVSVRAVDLAIAAGNLPARRLGSRVLIPHQSLVEFISEDRPTLTS
jgi:excisionase family DNA binding protein